MPEPRQGDSLAGLARALHQGAALTCKDGVFRLHFPDGSEQRAARLGELLQGLCVLRDRGRRAVFLLSGSLLADVTSVRRPDESLSGFIRAALRAEVRLRAPRELASAASAEKVPLEV